MIREKLKEKGKSDNNGNTTDLIKLKLNKAVKDLKKLLNEEKMQVYKYICTISVSLKYLITFYGRLLKN